MRLCRWRVRMAFSREPPASACAALAAGQLCTLRLECLLQCLLLQPILANEPVQGSAADAEGLRGVDFVVLLLRQDLLNVTALDFAQVARVAAAVDGSRFHQGVG